MNNSRKNDIDRLYRSLNKTLEHIDKEITGIQKPRKNMDVVNETGISNFNKHDSLLEKVNEVCNRAEKKKRPKARIIHHLACSGGSLISKCISALPNVYLLSEVHPFTTLHLKQGSPQFSPTDLISLSRHANIPHIDELTKQQFLACIHLSDTHIRKYGGTMVIRDHSHSDFCVDEYKITQSTVKSVLNNDFQILSALTLRNPIDSYLSLTKSNWVHFNPASFEEYCRRVLAFLKDHPETKVFLYEDFVADPKSALKDICRELELPYHEDSLEIFGAFRVTGDSGRTSGEIAPRKRHNLTKEFEIEIKSSSSYQLIKEKYQYS